MLSLACMFSQMILLVVLLNGSSFATQDKLNQKTTSRARISRSSGTFNGLIMCIPALAISKESVNLTGFGGSSSAQQ